MFTDRSDEPLSHKTESFALARVQPHTPWLLRSQWQLWSVLLFTVLLPLGILLYLIQTQVSVRLEKQAVSQNTLAAQLVAQAVQERFGNLKNNMKNLSRVRILTEAAANQNTETAREVLKQFIANNKDFDRMFLVDTAGKLWADYPADNSVAGKNFKDRDWFSGVSRSKAVYISEIYQRTAYPQPYITAIAAPVRNTRQDVLAYVAGQLQIETLMSWLWFIKPSAAGAVQLIDQHGNLIKRPESSSGESLLNIRRELNELPAAARTDSSARSRDPVTGEPSLISAVKIKSIGWTVLATQPLSSIFDTVRQIQVAISALFGFFLLLMMFLGFVSLNAVRRYHEILLSMQKSRERYFANLEQAVNERKQAEERVLNANQELKLKIDELARMNRIMMDRENRVLELKEKIRVLGSDR